MMMINSVLAGLSTSTLSPYAKSAALVYVVITALAVVYPVDPLPAFMPKCKGQIEALSGNVFQSLTNSSLLSIILLAAQYSDIYLFLVFPVMILRETLQHWSCSIMFLYTVWIKYLLVKSDHSVTLSLYEQEVELDLRVLYAVYAYADYYTATRLPIFESATRTLLGQCHAKCNECKPISEMHGRVHQGAL